MSVKLIKKYFNHLTEKQLAQFEMLFPLYKEWNAQINVVSRKDIDELYVKHILHSLAISKVVHFKDNTKILDVGTGGGFPGIPLAILFPTCQFVLIDSIGKKIKVVNEIATQLGLNNVVALHKRAEDVNEMFDFVVTRAVTSIANFLPWVKGKINKKSNHQLKNGILFLKGGDLLAEIEEAKKTVKIFPIADFFEEDFFETKKVVYLELGKK